MRPGRRGSTSGDHHVTKTARIGEVREDGLIHPVWESAGAIDPDPYLENYPWADEMRGRWSAPAHPAPAHDPVSGVVTGAVRLSGVR